MESATPPFAATLQMMATVLGLAAIGQCSPELVAYNLALAILHRRNAEYTEALLL